MRILISNDDGVQSAGIAALVKVLHGEHEIVVAAPAGQQSAKAHAITVRDKLYVESYEPLQKKYGIKALAITGTPADTVKLYLEGILQGKPDEMPDLVLSGINDGSNVGTDLLYSGTLGAASEGFVHGIQSIAVSLDYNAELSFEEAAELFKAMLPTLLKASSKKQLLNVNFPAKLQRPCRWYWSAQGIRDYDNAYVPQRDEQGRLYYTVGGTPLDVGNAQGSDVLVTQAGHVSVTPLMLNKTDWHFLEGCFGKELKQK